MGGGVGIAEIADLARDRKTKSAPQRREAEEENRDRKSQNLTTDQH
jgi:hypothetical protein